MQTTNIRIVFLIRALDFGGAQRQLVALARGLRQAGHSVVIATFYPDLVYEKDLAEAGVETVSLAKRGRWDTIPFIWRLVRFLHAERPAVLHSYLGTSNMLAAAMKPLFPSVRMVWGVRASNLDMDNYDWLSRLSYKIECNLSHLADLIIVNSHAGFDFAAANGFPERKMVVVPNGIDTDRFQPRPDERERLRSRWGILEDEQLIGIIGRFDPMKDHANFLRAAALLARENGKARFVCIGDGPEPYRSVLHMLAEDLGLSSRLIWAGAMREMQNVYSAFDLACSSSANGEGFPNVVGEAMACGVPCVVTHVGDSAWIVGDEDRTVPPGDPEALAAALARALAAERVRLATDSRARIVEHFSVARLVDRTRQALCL